MKNARSNDQRVCRKLFRRAVSICLFGALFCAATPALDRDRSLTQFHHTSWIAKDGAPSQISALAQTDDGYLWIGSAKGLFRFDGVRFEAFAPADANLPSYNIYALMPAPDNGLWISFRPSGLGFLKNGRIEVFSRPEELPRSQVYCFARDLDNRIWAGTHDGLALRDGARWLEIGADWNFKPQRIRSMFVDRDGTLWAATDETIVYLKRGSKTFQETGARIGAAHRIVQAADSRLWMAETSRSVRPVPLAPENPGAPPTPEIMTGAIDMFFDRDGAMWITSQDGLMRVRYPERLKNRKIPVTDAGVEVYNEKSGLSGDSAIQVLEDREGTIWVSTSKGLDRFRYCHFVSVTASQGQRNFTLLAGSSGEIWAGSAGTKPLTLIRGNELTAENKVINISSFYRAANETVWWGGYGGVWRQQNGRFDFFPQPKETKIDWVWEVLRADDEGGLWVGLGDEGLVYFRDGVWSRRVLPEGLLARVPSASYHASPGKIWLGYTENRVALLENDKARLFTSADGLDIGRIRVIRGRAGESLWFGGELGLALFDGTRFRSIRKTGGEAFGTVSGIVTTADGALWLNEVHGVVYISPDEVRKAVENPAHQVGFRLYDFLDGLLGAPQMNWTVSTAVEASDGRLWFATDNGLAWIEPSKTVKNEVPPPVAVRAINTSEKTYETGAAPLSLPKGTESLRIDYTALSLSVPERVRFRYRLENFDADWRDAETRREAFYTNLGPGDYRFRVIASNNDGVWNEQGAVVEFTILPRFYQTRWFLLLCAALLALLAWLGYQWRVRQVKSRLRFQFQERLDERTRIAQDLHDTLLQGFVSAWMQLDVAVDNLPADSPAKPRLVRVHEIIGQLIEDGRNTVKGLRAAETNGAIDFEQEFFRVRQDLDVRKQVDFRVRIEGASPAAALDPVVHAEALFIGHEALVNAFRHANATVIEVEIEYASKNFRIRVRDNGVGIDPPILHAGRDGHWGLSGMRERAEKIGARLKVRSRTAGGTEIELTIPNRIAFKNHPKRRVPAWLRKFYAPNEREPEKMEQDQNE